MELLLPLLITMPASALPLIGVSLAIGVMVAALSYMIAYFMQSPQMVALAKEELAALLFTVFIIFFWFTFDTALNGIVTGVLTASLPDSLMEFAQGDLTSQGLVQNHLNLALGSLSILDTQLKAAYIDLYLYEALIGFLSTITFPLGSPFPAVAIISFSLAPFTGLVMLSNAHTMIVETVGYLVTIIWGKEFILIFARDAVPLFLLPLGIVLRALPFFRKTGSSIIAMSFALYFVLPLAMLLSNYLIFDVYVPPDFTYTPSAATLFDSDRDQGEIEGAIQSASNPESGPAEHMLKQWTEVPSVVEETYDDPTDACVGNILIRFLCSAKNFLGTAAEVVGSFLATIWQIWKFMMGMTGDFFMTAFNNPLLPASASAGLYHFIIMEINNVSPLMILIIVTTVVEIIITVTMYRNIALLIGGEPEIIGITKLV